jgi:predicted acyl esterase
VKKLLVGLLLILATYSYGNICLNISLPETDKYVFHNDISIETVDNLKLSANLFIPKTKAENGHPTIIFANSWMLEEHEYLRQSIELAKKGYQVLSYSSRGWGCSEGKINVIGHKDVSDLSKVIDWLYENTDVDKQNIGIAGISYGGGLTLMGLAKEPRIKTGFAMSAWASLEEALYGNDTPRLFWGTVLVSTGLLLGEVDSDIIHLFKSLVRGENLEEVRQWAAKRSPINYIENINKRGAPVYISNNFGDNLFQPNNVMKFYDKLTVPKVLDLNQGTHATGEITGLFTLSNYTFQRLHQWFDYWLKGQKGNIALNTVNIQTGIEHKRESYDSIELKSLNAKTYYLHPRKLTSGKLSSEKYMGEDTQDTVVSLTDSFASTGIPLLSALVSGNFKLPTYTFLPIRTYHDNVAYFTDRLKEKKEIRGIANLKINLDSKSNFQVVAYLYDVNKIGAAKLITHGVFSGRPSVNSQISFDLVATAYDVPQGHKLALVVDTQDSLYARSSLIPYRLNFNYFEDKQMQLTLKVK